MDLSRRTAVFPMDDRSRRPRSSPTFWLRSVEFVPSLEMNNPYTPSHTSPDSAVSNQAKELWPYRLTVGLVAFPILVHFSMLAVQLSRSTNVYDRTVGAMESLAQLIPGMVLLPTIAVSTIRLTNSSTLARRIASMLLAASLLLNMYICIELMKGPIRGF